MIRTGPRVEELVKLEIDDLERIKSRGYFKDCKKNSDGWFYLKPTFSESLWKFIDEDVSGSNPYLHKSFDYVCARRL